MNTNCASMGKRTLAFIIDSFLAEIFASLVFFFVLLIAGEIFIWAITLLSTLAFILYFTLFEGSSAQATPGKQLMKIRVVGANNTRVTYSTAFLRSLIFNFLFLIDILVAFFNSKEGNISLHDKLTSTYVANNAAPIPYQPTPAPVANPYSSPSIVCISGVYAGNTFPLGNGIIIGTDPTVCQIVLPANTGVSRNHCKISFDINSNMFVIHDMGSTNGTFLDNGQQVPQAMPYAVHPGTRFYLATRINSFELRI